MSKQAKKNNELSSKILCGFFVFSIICLNLGFTTTRLSQGNQVYCPLQKTWVEPNTPVEKSNFFDNICASDRTKYEIALEISMKSVSVGEITENLVFDYLAHGSIALQNLPQESPSENIIKRTKFPSSTSNYSNEFILKLTIALTSEQFARPPSFTRKSYFPPQTDKTLEKISRNINPRSPPVFS
jgi:hypothetical protein